MESPNLDYIKKLAAGDIEFEKKIIEILKNELPEEIKLYESFVFQNNYKDTADLVHKLKHKISILGLVNSYKIAVDFENNLLKKK